MKSTTARSLLTLCLVAAACGPVRAERGDFNDPHDPYVAAIGLALGYSSGTGLSVRWPALPQVMAMATGGLWGRKGDVAWNTGLELHYVLRQSGSGRVHVGPGVAIYSDNEDEEADVNASFSVGGEILFWRRTAIKLDLGFTYLGDEGDILPLPQFALLFYF
jgi:hypothetical protein